MGHLLPTSFLCLLNMHATPAACSVLPPQLGVGLLQGTDHNCPSKSAVWEGLSIITCPPSLLARGRVTHLGLGVSVRPPSRFG